MTETEFVNLLITSTKRQLCMCELFGWQSAHFRPAYDVVRQRYSTPVQGDGKGYPDLFLIKPPRFLWAECKSDKGRLSDEQIQWLNILSECHEEVYVWRPRDLDEIEKILQSYSRDYKTRWLFKGG